MFSRSAEAIRRRGRTSLRVRLTLLFGLVTSLAMALLGFVLHLSLSVQLDLQEREELLGKLAQFSHLLADLPDRAWIGFENSRFNELLLGHKTILADIMDQSGKPLTALSSFPWPLEQVEQAASAAGIRDVVETHDRRYHLLLAAVPVGHANEQVVVGLAHDRSETLLLLSRFRQSVLVALVVGTVVAGGLGYIAAVRGLIPLHRFAETAKRIRAQRLGERLDCEAVPEELRELATSFNGMLSRLEESFQRLTRFSDDLAHELRTPLGNLMLHAQVALGRPRSETHLREVLVSGLEELQRLSRMVNDMLFLAKADNAQIALRRERVSLEVEVDKVLEFFEPLASERGIELLRRGSGEVRADPSMMRRAIANLVSNAVRYAKPGSTLWVRIETSPGEVELSVDNEGEALPEAERQRVFDRFYRGADRGSGLAEGVGLGLAIVKSIVELHGGHVSASSAEGRTVFSVKLTSAAAEAEQRGRQPAVLQKRNGAVRAASP